VALNIATARYVNVSVMPLKFDRSTTFGQSFAETNVLCFKI